MKLIRVDSSEKVVLTVGALYDREKCKDDSNWRVNCTTILLDLDFSTDVLPRQDYETLEQKLYDDNCAMAKRLFKVKTFLANDTVEMASAEKKTFSIVEVEIEYAPKLRGR